MKLDELIRVTQGAHNALFDLEELDEKELDKIRTSYEDIAKSAGENLKMGKIDTEVLDI